MGEPVLSPGFHKEELGKTTFTIPERYQDLTSIGTGAYGAVVSASDTENTENPGAKVAIKKLSRPFQSLMHAKRCYREIRLLMHMRHENIIDITDLFTPQASLADFQDVYFVSTHMGADLSKIMKVQVLSDEHIQFLIYQVLRGLKYIHSAGVIHRDLKPQNIGVDENAELRILDFGLARSSDDSMTGYVATRWYRAPEIMLNWMQYNSKVDIWSVGCIMGELFAQRVLFPGDDHIDQLTQIMTLCGKPEKEFLDRISSDNARSYIQSMPSYTKKEFTDIFKRATPEAIDFLYKTLQLDPEKRLSAAECLQHPYFANYYDPEDEPDCPSVFEHDDSSPEYTVEKIKELLFDTISKFEPPPPLDE